MSSPATRGSGGRTHRHRTPCLYRVLRRCWPSKQRHDRVYQPPPSAVVLAGTTDISQGHAPTVRAQSGGVARAARAQDLVGEGPAVDLCSAEWRRRSDLRYRCGTCDHTDCSTLPCTAAEAVTGTPRKGPAANPPSPSPTDVRAHPHPRPILPAGQGHHEALRHRPDHRQQGHPQHPPIPEPDRPPSTPPIHSPPSPSSSPTSPPQASHPTHPNETS